MTATLPPLLPPAGLGREDAAAFCGIKRDSFDVAVREGRLPQPIRFGRKNGRFIWTVKALEVALEKLQDMSATNRRQAQSGGWKDVGKDAIRRRQT